MSVTRVSYYADNISSPDGGHTYGPLQINGVLKIVEAECNISFTSPGGSIGAGATIVGGIAWGMQHVPRGSSALVLPANLGASGWFWSRNSVPPSIGNAFWAPDSATAEYLAQWNDGDRWTGQLPVNSNIDVYVGTGKIVAAVGNFAAALTMSVTYTY